MKSRSEAKVALVGDEAREVGLGLLQARLCQHVVGVPRALPDSKVDVRLPGKGTWCEAGPPDHHDVAVDADHQVVNQELFLSA